MKQLFVIILALFVGFAYGENENVPTSKKFVDAALAQKQPKFEALGNDKLMLYSDTTDGAVTSRDIVTTLGTSTSADTVPTVGAINAGLATKQDVLNGPSGWVAENTGVAGAVVQKPVYSATNNYSNALVEVETLNNAVINAVNSELTVVPSVGWTINTANNLNLLPVPKTYNPYLPDGYTQLEYLGVSGTQYIDTGIAKTSLNFKVSATISFADTTGRYLIGTGGNSPNYCGRAPDGHFELNYSDRTTLTSGIDEIVTLDYYGTGGIRVYMTVTKGNETETLSGRGHQSLSDDTFVIFGNHHGNYYGGILNGKIYSAKVYIDNVLRRNFIPVRRNSDGELGMYDTVSDIFFTNTGSGTFTAGPDVYF